MKASKYERKWVGKMPDAVLNGLMQDHKCIHHAGANSGACLTCLRRADMICDLLWEEFKVDIIGFDPLPSELART